jgi:transcriptional regulator with XRE-family HTH domain
MARRIQLGWSQKQLAEASGTTQARISLIESGDAGIKLGTIDKVLKALGLTDINPNFREDAVTSEIY